MKHCVPAVFTVQNALEYIWLEWVYVRKNELNKLGYLDYYFGKSTFFFFGNVKRHERFLQMSGFRE